jgi:hypothetical protein
VESLKENRSLVNFMDDNLTIHMEDYLANPLIFEKYQFTREAVTEAIKRSIKYSYDQANDTIKLKYRPKRLIIVIREVIKEKQTEEEIRQLVKTLAGEESEKNLRKVEKVNELMFLYFEKEEDTLDVFVKLEKALEKKDVNY